MPFQERLANVYKRWEQVIIPWRNFFGEDINRYYLKKLRNLANIRGHILYLNPIFEGT